VYNEIDHSTCARQMSGARFSAPDGVEIEIGDRATRPSPTTVQAARHRSLAYRIASVASDRASVSSSRDVTAWMRLYGEANNVRGLATGRSKLVSLASARTLEPIRSSFGPRPVAGLAARACRCASRSCIWNSSALWQTATSWRPSRPGHGGRPPTRPRTWRRRRRRAPRTCHVAT